MKKLMLMVAVMVMALAGCGNELKVAARNKGLPVPPEMQQHWRCEGTLYFLPDSGQAYCDGKIMVNVEGYEPKKESK